MRYKKKCTFSFVLNPMALDLSLLRFREVASHMVTNIFPFHLYDTKQKRATESERERERGKLGAKWKPTLIGWKPTNILDFASNIQ